MEKKRRERRKDSQPQEIIPVALLCNLKLHFRNNVITALLINDAHQGRQNIVLAVTCTDFFQCFLPPSSYFFIN